MPTQSFITFSFDDILLLLLQQTSAQSASVLFRSTLQEIRPNKAGLKCLSVNLTSVLPQKVFFDFNEI